MTNFSGLQPVKVEFGYKLNASKRQKLRGGEEGERVREDVVFMRESTFVR